VGRRVFSREFKLEAVRLVLERGVKVGEAARDLGIRENGLRRWIKDFKADQGQAFPGRGKMKPDDAEVARLKRELAKTKTERDILKKAIAYFVKEPQ
jgi:transposase